ncbi:hypothetical protein M409DRAFT_56711 [Zasmidium cellare ATCC 36951]|uniref:Amidase domain-containing protein n=1 Tax=Zasmidium cellare ATCC 36951 TaxID=1080233 RepID=A0A6A6CFJ7_ZASCE|nr:uncharacterized protein M409DRAFT_56711 [Zasmidium cellare ATCC 36951]KAF2164449.1 hypothetical protein M409DRAFT_56711 [Zasmidium cellare ATCC 36951]
MSVVTLGENPNKLDTTLLQTITSNAGLTLNPSHINDWTILLGTLDEPIAKILAEEDYTLTPDLAKYPRSNISIPQNELESDQGGWATKFISKATTPKNDLLAGKTVALKDNIAFASVRCTNGTTAFEWTPTIDAPVATRILDAGATITGKATCENACMEGDSDTSCTGPVHNFYAHGYSCGGSSSGSGRLVASGAVDLAVGGDQGGSIRIPASMCGIVGLKPTWGLVPYTGILSLEATIDHAGPMARTVADCAALLETLAGPDGIDDRQPPNLPRTPYTTDLSAFLATAPSTKPLTGMRLGILTESLQIPGIHPAIVTLFHRAVAALRDLGAEVKDISIPLHADAAVVWMCSLPLSGAPTALLNESMGRKQLHLNDREPVTKLKQEEFDKLGPGAQNLYLRYLYLKHAYGAKVHGKCTNLLRKINDGYDAALHTQVDVLLTPTLPCPPSKLFPNPETHGPLERLSRNLNLVANTAPFNSTGHPALSLPMGFVPASTNENETIKLPAGLQIVGRKFCEGDLFKVGACWEGRGDWKEF